MFKRTQTNKVMVGDVQIGHSNHVVIQSMTNTKTSDVANTLKQINHLVGLGCELVRVAILDQNDLDALSTIVKKTPCPIIADIHYNYEFAIKAILAGAKKIRINPGNIANKQQLKQIVETAKKYKVAIRVGFNTGSWSKVNTIINEAKKYIKLFESWNFKDIVLAFKSSNPQLTTKLYLDAAKVIRYPLHLGVTECGTKTSAIIKTTIGLSPLLQVGIGDTIRVSITGSPLQEPIIAKKLLNNFGLYNKIPNIISCPTCGRLQWKLDELLSKVETYTNSINKNIDIAIMGCSVNGVGECKHADVGVFGNKTHAVIYNNGKLYKTVKHKQAFYVLKQLIDKC